MLPIGTPGAVSQMRAIAPQTGTHYKGLFQFGVSVKGDDGVYPSAALVKSGTRFYGTTVLGGHTAKSGLGYGTVFSVTASGQERVLHSFSGISDGAFPAAGLVSVKGTLYGTTGGNGVYTSTYGNGTIFSLKRDGSGFRVLHAFQGTPDGAYPLASLLWYRGRFYGTTRAGGAYGYGTVFSMTREGYVTVLHSFSGHSGYSGPDGGQPASALIVLNKELYGTTEFGGTHRAGTVFAMTLQGQETWVYSFTGAESQASPRYPVAALIAVSGNLYGTSYDGGANGYGSVFSMSADGSSSTVLHSFASGSGDGAYPAAPLTYLNGKFYGTTNRGGFLGAGTIFAVDEYGNEQIEHNFGTYRYGDGLYPVAPLFNVNGTMYGTTTQGGISQPSCPFYNNCDWGTVFAFTP